MPYEFSRTDRVSEQIRRDLSDLIRKLKDPRVGMVTLLDVEVSRDLAHAKVYFDAIDQSQIQECTEGLNRAAGFLRRELGKTSRLRTTPSLKFIYDDTQVRGNALSDLIDQAVQSDQQND